MRKGGEDVYMERRKGRKKDEDVYMSQIIKMSEMLL